MLCDISLTYIRAINLCVLCVFVVRSTSSPAGLYLRIHFTHQTEESQKITLLMTKVYIAFPVRKRYIIDAEKLN
ncbi:MULTISPECIES: hypothetical protein [unclassified Microcystis]|uniref:hypothetical protein n=1 Tax=unclassified Microcystis TaxID=2643300 RepID=UPI0022BB09C7|nr:MULTISPECIES: hypothetical protein [unclassified Microcystis]MCZ8201360.1 hypothetical protein [Microcystis sp. LE19-55.1A]MCZ8309080.1 hypothetical protein [Microcystis sp. LE19-98.1E]